MLSTQERKANFGNGLVETMYETTLESRSDAFAMADFAFDCVLDAIQKYQLQRSDSIRVALQGYVNDAYRFISCKMTTVAQQRPETILQTIMNALNSSEAFQVTNVYILHLRPSCGSGKRGTSKQPFSKKFGSRSIIKVPSFPNDHSCCPRALVQLTVYKDRHTDVKQYTRFRSQSRISNRNTQECHDLFLMARALCNLAEVDFNTPCSNADILKLSKALTLQRGHPCHIRVYDELQGMILSYTTLTKDIIQAAPEVVEQTEFFDLLLHDGHYSGITRNYVLLGKRKKYCNRCNKAYTNNHNCKMVCAMCSAPTCHYALAVAENHANWITCDHCNRRFYGEECFARHQEGDAKSACNTVWKCRKRCTKQLFKRSDVTPEDHVCGQVRCKNCNVWHTVGDTRHQCYMKPIAPKEPNEKLIFADIECTQDTGLHLVNLISTCEHTGDGKLVQWPTYTTLEAWLDVLVDTQYAGYTVIFHNGRSYDFLCVVDKLLQRRATVQPIMTGSKILYLTLANAKKYSPRTGIRFVDSLNFLTMPLSKFTKTFGLTTKKGYFPHLFNTPENQNYVGTIPDEEYFMPSNMTDDAYLKFKEWYNQQQGVVWDFKKEFYEYCEADALLLGQGCLKFRQIVLAATHGVHDPFQHITLASSALALYKSTMLEENLIGALPADMIRELRAGFCGGRTGGCKLWYSCAPDERIEYVDFTSLYPFINKNMPYPVGHPTVHTAAPWPSYYDVGLSIWKVDVICPQTLYMPLLHSKTPGHAELRCDLKDKVEQLYTNIELKEAFRLGYKVKTVHKVWVWHRTRCGLFADYINLFLKLKQQSAGWPRPNMTEEAKDTYIQDYAQHEDIKLDRKLVKENEGVYRTAKLYLNSLWGKMGQRLDEDFTVTKILHASAAGQLEFNKIQASGLLADLTIINEHTIVTSVRRPKIPSHEVCASSSIPIAIFTTAHARLKLYRDFLEPLGRRVLYYDTDSVLFVHKTSENPAKLISLGSYLGEPTNELEKNMPTAYSDSNFITEFRCAGPKNYAFVTNTGAVTLKVKGVSTSKRYASNLLSFDMMSSAILSDNKLQLTFNQIQRSNEFKITTSAVTKTYQCTFAKRRRLPVERNENGLVMCIDSVPWERELPKTSTLATPRKRKRSQVTDDLMLYLITSTTIANKYYIGETKSVATRLRQHNGELPGGAAETSVGRPWQLLVYITGYTSRTESNRQEYKAKNNSLNNSLCPGYTAFTTDQKYIARFLYHLKRCSGKTIRVHTASPHVNFIQTFMMNHCKGATLSLYQ